MGNDLERSLHNDDPLNDTELCVDKGSQPLNIILGNRQRVD